MAVNIKDLTLLASPAVGDKIPIIDTSDTTDSAEGTLKISTAQDIVDLAATGSYQPLDADLTAIAGLTPSNDDFIQRKTGAWTNRTVSQVKTDLGISNVDNTSDLSKPISTATQTALDGKVDENGAITAGSDKSLITYDAKGLITSGSDLPVFLPKESGVRYTSILTSSTSSAAAITTGTVYLIPFYEWERGKSYSSVEIDVTSGGTNARVGIWNYTTGALIHDTGSFSVSSVAVASSSISFSTTIHTWYWLGITVDANTSVRFFAANAMRRDTGSPGAQNTYYGRSQYAFTYGALGALPALTKSTSGPPALYLVAS